MKSVRWFLVLAVFVLGLSVSRAGFAIPVTEKFRAVITLGDGQVEAEFSMAYAVPTGISIGEFFPSDPGPKIMPHMSTAADVEARTAEFINAHDEIFHVTTADLSPPFLAVPISLGWWRLYASQTYGGIPVVGSYFNLDVTSDGELLSLRTSLYPTAEMRGVRLDPAFSKEQAIQLSNAISPLLVVVSSYWSEPSLVIAFRSFRPVLAWQMELGDSRCGPPPHNPICPLPEWQSIVTADTGEVLGLWFRMTCDSPFTCPRSYAPFIRGDANGDSKVDIADATFTLDLLFLGRAVTWCRIASDSNGDSSVDVSDPIYSLGFLFLGGPPPPPPYPSPGIAIAPDFTGCAR